MTHHVEPLTPVQIAAAKEYRRLHPNVNWATVARNVKAPLRRLLAYFDPDMIAHIRDVDNRRNRAYRIKAKRVTREKVTEAQIAQLEACYLRGLSEGEAGRECDCVGHVRRIYRTFREKHWAVRQDKLRQIKNENARRERVGLRPHRLMVAGTSVVVPEYVLAERERRYAAEALLTPAQQLQGEPPPGYSALDRK